MEKSQLKIQHKQLLENIFNSWKNLTSGSTNRKIFGVAFMLAIFTAGVKLATIGKELVVAWKFGTSDELDAFLIALIVPSFIINLIASSFNAGLIPTYIQVREQEGKVAAQKLLSGVMVWSLGLLIITTMLMVSTAPLYLPKLASGFSAEKLNLTFRLLCLLSPIVIISGIQTTWGAVLNAGERFALAALSPMITPIISILFMVIFYDWSIFALVSGFICGVALETVLLGIALHKQKISLLPRWYGFDPYLRQVAGQYLPMFAGSFLMGSSSLVDQSMAAMLTPGSVAALNYGNRIISMLINLSTYALSTAAIPYLSKMIAARDFAGIHDTVKRYIYLIFLATLPIVAGILIFSHDIARIAFQRGSFTSNDVNIVARIQSFFALQIPFYIAGILIVNFISAIRYNHILMWISALNLIVNVIGNYLFMHWLGISGIALSTSCVYIISFTILSLFVRNKFKLALFNK